MKALMTQRRQAHAAAIVLGAVLGSFGPAIAEQMAIRDYNEASDVFWGGLYPDAFTELYCGASRQRAPLEAWIDALTEKGAPFVIAGDWNRRIDIHAAQDHLWQEIDDGAPAPLDLFRFPENVTSPYLFRTPDHRPRPIDFMVLDEQAAPWVDASSATIVDFREEDKPERRQISDHCPVTLDLFVPTRGLSGGRGRRAPAEA